MMVFCVKFLVKGQKSSMNHLQIFTGYYLCECVHSTLELALKCLPGTFTQETKIGSPRFYVWFVHSGTLVVLQNYC